MANISVDTIATSGTDLVPARMALGICASQLAA
jgi:hypothetical protein